MREIGREYRLKQPNIGEILVKKLKYVNIFVIDLVLSEGERHLISGSLVIGSAALDIGGKSMDKIAMVKKEIQLQNWSDKELARQELGLTVTEWCRREKISTSAYYYRLRRIRENLCEQIPVADVDSDGEITANDALAVLRYSVGLADENSPINKPIAA